MDDIQIDKVAMCDEVLALFDRLLKENYIGRTGEVYNFLTNDEVRYEIIRYDKRIM